MQDLKSAIVIDTGAHTIKAGLGGEARPSKITPCVRGVNPFNKDGIYYGDSATSKMGFLKMESPIKDGLVKDREMMIDLWDFTMDDLLGVDVCERPLMMSQPVHNCKDQVDWLSEIVFEEYLAPSLYIAHPPTLAQLSIGLTCGVVIDIGESQTQVVTVADGYQLASATSRISFGGQKIRDFVCQEFMEKGKGNDPLKINCAAIDFLYRRCTVPQDYQKVQDFYKDRCEMPDSSPTNRPFKQIYCLPDGSSVDIGLLRHKVGESLFNPYLLGYDMEGIHKLLEYNIKKADLNIQSSLRQSITVTGGCSLFKGLDQRLESEMKLFSQSKFKSRVIAPVDRIRAPWLGGSILAVMDDFIDQSVSSQEYEEEGSRLVFKKFNLI